MMDMTDTPLLKTTLEGEWLAAQLPSELSPEKNLMAAVLSDAVNVALRPDTGTQSCRRERALARCWITSLEADRVFCFIHICEVLHVDPNQMRRKIMAGWKQAA